MHIPKRPCRMVELAVMPTNQIRAIFQIYWHLSRAERSKFVRSFTSKLQDAGRRGGGGVFIHKPLTLHSSWVLRSSVSQGGA